MTIKVRGVGCWIVWEMWCLMVLNACLINIVEVRHGPMYHGDAFTDVDTVGGLCFGRQFHIRHENADNFHLTARERVLTH